MRTLERNKKLIYYALYDHKEEMTDEYGNKTGEYKICYSAPIPIKINTSAAQGEITSHYFGTLENYDKVLVTDNMNLPLTDTSVLWIDSLDISQPYDYTVKKVALSLNSILIAVSKVKVSA